MITPEQRAADEENAKELRRQMQIILATHGVEKSLKAIASLTSEYSQVPDNSAGYWMRVNQCVEECIAVLEESDADDEGFIGRG